VHQFFSSLLEQATGARSPAKTGISFLTLRTAAIVLPIPVRVNVKQFI